MEPKTRQTIAILARFGYGARGLVYLMIGVLAALAAIDSGGQVAGSKGTLLTFLSAPSGWVWLALMGLGLLCFSLWRVFQGVTDADYGERPESKEIWARIAHLVSALLYFGTAWWAITVALGFATRGPDGGPQDWTAWLLGQPFGAWLVAGAGLGMVCLGLYLLLEAWREDFGEDFAGDAQRWLGALGKWGHAARAVVFVLIGLFLILAGWQSDPSEAEGLGGALRRLQQQPYGWILLALTAAGLSAFGAFNLARGVWGHVYVPRDQRA